MPKKHFLKHFSKPFFVTLKNRGLIRVSGADRFSFLQGLITNDIELLHTQPCLYACLLTPQGKFLHDFFISQDDETLLIDCEGGERAQDLNRRLSLYKLRSDVNLDIQDEHDVYAVFDAPDFGMLDPRHTDIGTRSSDRPGNMNEHPFEEWDLRRIELTLPDGSRDLLVEKSTMDEGRMDKINAISYDKGCYVGQELTARMHYRGLGKKHLQTVDIDQLPEKAELRSSCNGRCLALIRH